MSPESVEFFYDAAIVRRQRDQRGRAAKFSSEHALMAGSWRLALFCGILAPVPPVSSRCRLSIANTSRGGQLNGALE